MAIGHVPIHTGTPIQRTRTNVSVNKLRLTSPVSLCAQVISITNTSCTRSHGARSTTNGILTYSSMNWIVGWITQSKICSLRLISSRRQGGKSGHNIIFRYIVEHTEASGRTRRTRKRMNNKFVLMCSQVSFSPLKMSTTAGWFGFLITSNFTIARSAGFTPVNVVMTVMVLFYNVGVKATIHVNVMSPLCTSPTNKLCQTLTSRLLLQRWMIGGIKNFI